MNYQSLSLEELARMIPADPDARRYVADNAEALIDQAVDAEMDSNLYDPAGCWGDGCNEGRARTLSKLADKYSDDLLEQIEKHADNESLTTLLAAIHADFEDEPETVNKS